MDIKQLALQIGNSSIVPPQGVPEGGLDTTGANVFALIRNLLTLVAVVLAMIFIILGGIRWSTSGGDAKAVEAARKQITYAVIGIVIALLAWSIVKFLGDFLTTPLTG